MMNIEEVARAIEYLHALGISHEETCNFLKYVATGVGLPVKESAAEEEYPNSRKKGLLLAGPFFLRNFYNSYSEEINKIYRRILS